MTPRYPVLVPAGSSIAERPDLRVILFRPVERDTPAMHKYTIDPSQLEYRLELQGAPDGVELA